MITCHYETRMSSDTAYWVPVGVFNTYFDQHDFVCYRDAANVIDAYSNDWFHTKPDGSLVLELATIQIVNDKTQFFSGRRRVSVLLKHLDPLPIAFGENAIEFANKLKLELIDLSNSVQIPNLQKRQF